MGHVDHGKTKTLDAIRATHVMEGESGGITQHIGAYQVEKKGQKITFIDTPGHEAFTIMRSRGAKVADVAVLVVAADDGVQPQTKEVVDIIKAAKLPFVVALNKIDKADADPNRVMGQLAELGVTVEAWGGNVPMAKISAKTGEGIDDLLEVILLIAEIEKGKILANPTSLAAGTVIEAHVDKGEGPVATVIVQNGTLHRNDWLSIAGAAYGRVRALRDWTGKMVDEAPPGMPVKILGLKVGPSIGDILEVPKDHKTLTVVKPKVSRGATETFTAVRAIPSLTEETQKKVMLNIVLKTDVLGSLEAILGMLEKIKHDQVGVEVIQKGLGNVNESDIERAATTRPSVVYGFSVMMPSVVEASARDKNVEVKMCKVIYDLFDDVVVRLNALLPQEVTVTNVGRAEVAAIFRTEPGKMIVGARVKEGKVVVNAKIRVWRGEDPISEGLVESLQLGKSPAKEAPAGHECGITFRGKMKLEAGDILEFYTEESKVQKIEIIR
jgi:translation initiation factor IF-2